MSIICGLDLHRQQITFDALETETGEVWRGLVWRPDRERLRRWLSGDVARRTDGEPVVMAVEGCTGWRYVVEADDGGFVGEDADDGVGVDLWVSGPRRRLAERRHRPKHDEQPGDVRPQHTAPSQ
jgi:hypothetical protein